MFPFSNFPSTDPLACSLANNPYLFMLYLELSTVLYRGLLFPIAATVQCRYSFDTTKRCSSTGHLGLFYSDFQMSNISVTQKSSMGKNSIFFLKAAANFIMVSPKLNTEINPLIIFLLNV